MPVTVRPALPADAEALAHLAAVTFPLACPPDSTPQAQQAFIRAVLSVERFTDYLADPARTLLLAHDPDSGDEPLGYTMLVDGDPADADVRAAIRLLPTIELSKCYVLPGHHGQGVASELMAASLRAGRERGAVGMWLGVNQLNARAQAFYHRHGFERVGVKRFLVGDRLDDDFVLERAL
ncbi:GNAT family N-acetyltransferase [Cellulomonas cellasea]|uniref:GNAT family N-acetyltransferase n=1 Tax=Cellulomonas cellasea TaxID=43670 RepID=UPI0025A37F8D|nr:GNAT family N-acetyltransferase [Cellulomonas cellasea]MDM8085549.1 GNAT family N-acetyltransferase [Cellulomonas cellasea]